MTNRQPVVLRIVLIPSMLWLAWLLMMLVHEGGHVLGAVATGGTVRRVVWHPAVISRTDVEPNPWPGIEVWAGPIVGCVVPVMLGGIVSALRWRVAYLVWMFAGFCLIANGVYLGVGAFDPVGDAKQLAALGTPAWVLGAIGWPMAIAGFAIWHRISPRFGFGRSAKRVDRVHAYGAFAVAIAITLLGLMLGNRAGG